MIFEICIADGSWVTYEKTWDSVIGKNIFTILRYEIYDNFIGDYVDSDISLLTEKSILKIKEKLSEKE